MFDAASSARSKSPYLSILIPCHNHSPDLKILLDSIAFEHALIGFDLEVIVCDDASQPPIQWHGDYPDLSIQMVRFEQNQGPAAARNFAARHARGEIFLFLDSDTKLVPGTCNALYRLFFDTR